MKTLPEDVLQTIERELPGLAPLVAKYRATPPDQAAGLERQIAQNIPPWRGLEIFPRPAQWNALCRVMHGEPYELRERG